MHSESLLLSLCHPRFVYLLLAPTRICKMKKKKELILEPCGQFDGVLSKMWKRTRPWTPHDYVNPGLDVLSCETKDSVDSVDVEVRLWSCRRIIRVEYWSAHAQLPPIENLMEMSELGFSFLFNFSKSFLNLRTIAFFSTRKVISGSFLAI